MNSCGTCRFWKPYSSDDERGQCRAHPPVVVGGERRLHIRWPSTNSEDWCGEWEQKPAPPNFQDPVPPK